MMRIAVAQTRTHLRDRAANVAKAINYVEQAAAQNADLVLLPETY